MCGPTEITVNEKLVLLARLQAAVPDVAIFPAPTGNADRLRAAIDRQYERIVAALRAMDQGTQRSAA